MYKTALMAATVAAITAPAIGIVTVDVGVSTDGSSIANSINVTTTDYGWSGAQLYFELDEGSVINLDPGFGGVDIAPTQAQIDVNPALLFDTFYGVVGNPSQGLGGAFELTGLEPLDLGPSSISATWTAPPGLAAPSNQLAIGNFVFSDDASGNVTMVLSEPFYRPFYFYGSVDDGVLSLFSTGLIGDLTGDLFVGIEDLNVILSHWNETVTPGDLLAGDPTGDAFVGIEDLGVVLGNWNASVSDLMWPEGTDPDLDGDGFVGITELNLVLANWHQNVTPGDVLSGDVSGDGFVGFDDYVIVNALWNAGTPPAVLVPEPVGITLLSLGTLALLRRRRA